MNEDSTKTAAKKDSISLLPATADALSELGLGTFQTVETPERMAWVVLVLCELPDDPNIFPHGKWGLIQHIEDELENAARAAAEALGRGFERRMVRHPSQPGVCNGLCHMGASQRMRWHSDCPEHGRNRRGLAGAPGAPAGPPEGDPTPVQAPWTYEQVANLNGYQASGVFHPFTHGEGEDKVELIATVDGWKRRLDGPVVQTWAHRFVLDGSWRRAEETLLALRPGLDRR